ncbi:MAG: DEAD/DEAH box helicase [Rikenellaceae bacterium]|nr:DEAD/DEAH box helicase [Rikenellaceae bacterium]
MSKLEEFKTLGLDDTIIDAIAQKGFETPSAIQRLTIPCLLSEECDIIAQAQTGTGKTAAFGLPLVQLLEARHTVPQAIVLVPTRELALQVTGELQSFNTSHLTIAPIYGGASIEEQLRRLRRGVDVVVGTPGRILDHIRRTTLDLSQITHLILDEADEMLNMGFIEDIEEIMREMTAPHRVLLFSATMPDRIRALAEGFMQSPKLLKVESQTLTTELTNQIYFEVREGDKLDALTRIIDVEPDFYGIVFGRTKVSVDEIATKLVERGYSAEGLHGDISQGLREKILGKFRSRAVNILVATDVAARGIDISNLTHVINYSLPQDSESYVHRIGRTGRAGNQGTAITFISPSEMRQFGFLRRDINADIKLETLPSPADVVAIKRNKIKDDLYRIIQSETYTECAPMAEELLESYPADVVLSALLRLAFNNELSESNYPEIRSINVDRKGKSCLMMAIGARDGFDCRRLVKMLKRECGLTDPEIDHVKVMEDYSTATIPFERAKDVVAMLNEMSAEGPIAEIREQARGTKHGRAARNSRKIAKASERKATRREERSAQKRQKEGSRSTEYKAPKTTRSHKEKPEKAATKSKKMSRREMKERRGRR